MFVQRILRRVLIMSHPTPAFVPSRKHFVTLVHNLLANARVAYFAEDVSLFFVDVLIKAMLSNRLASRESEKPDLGGKP